MDPPKRKDLLLDLYGSDLSPGKKISFWEDFELSIQHSLPFLSTCLMLDVVD
jgi:hypothetical protein